MTGFHGHLYYLDLSASVEIKTRLLIQTVCDGQLQGLAWIHMEQLRVEIYLFKRCETGRRDSEQAIKLLESKTADMHRSHMNACRSCLVTQPKWLGHGEGGKGLPGRRARW